ncbi:MAG: phosphoribosyltransferase [Patescibacteria group bacterium]|nr:phosphoribosyltransferase [Patescibacteria group bacterium]
MKVKKISLYKRLDKRIIGEYSRFKFGDEKMIIKYSKMLATVIKKQLKDGKKYIIYTTSQSPLNKYVRQSSFVMSERVAKYLNLKLIVGQYKYSYNKETFYDNSDDWERDNRNIHRPHLNGKKQLRGGYDVLMIDDSIVSGRSLKASVDELKKITKNVMFFSIINLKNKRYTEEEVNNFYFKKKGIIFLKRILESKHAFTTQFIRIFEELDLYEKKILLKSINKNIAAQLNKAINIYV